VDRFGHAAGMDRWKLLADLAHSQFGLVAVWQVAQLGISRQVLAERAAEHGWTRVSHGVYLLPGHTLVPLARLKAVELALHEDGAAAGLAALYLWKIVKQLPRPAHFVVPPGCSRRPPGSRITISKALASRDVQARNGIRVLDPRWAICSAAPDLNISELKRHVMTGHRSRLLTVKSVRSTADELGVFKHRRKVYRALEEIEDEGIVHSQLERVGRDHLHRHGMVPHPHPYPVEHDGRLIAELDIAFIEPKVGIPIQGPHHLEEDQRRFDEDQRYELESIGWWIIPADEKRLKEQAHLFVKQVRDALRKRENVKIT
jgi:hypothetical protein